MPLDILGKVSTEFMLKNFYSERNDDDYDDDDDDDDHDEVYEKCFKPLRYTRDGKTIISI